MKIQTINNNNSTNFNASINKYTKDMKTACSYMERCKDYKPPYSDTKLELELFNLIEKAFKEHPSKEDLKINRFIVKSNSDIWNERASISSSRATLKDVEPVRDDSIAGELGILRRILDPANKDKFNVLMGIEHAKDYQPWWDKHIAPVWNLINENFRENPRIFPQVSDDIYNDCFKKQIDIYDYSKQKHHKAQTKNSTSDEVCNNGYRKQIGTNNYNKQEHQDTQKNKSLLTRILEWL